MWAVVSLPIIPLEGGYHGAGAGYYWQRDHWRKCHRKCEDWLATIWNGMFMCMYLCMCMCVCLCVHVCLCVFVYICVFGCVQMCVCMCVFVSLHCAYVLFTTCWMYYVNTVCVYVCVCLRLCACCMCVDKEGGTLYPHSVALRPKTMSLTEMWWRRSMLTILNLLQMTSLAASEVLQCPHCKLNTHVYAIIPWKLLFK